MIECDMIIMINELLWSLAGFDLLSSSVDWADILNESWSNSIFTVGRVVSIDSNPGDIGVGGDEVFSIFGKFNLPIISLLGAQAGIDVIPVDSGLSGTLLSLGGPVGSVGFKTNEERKSFGVVSIFIKLDCASFNEVSLAFWSSMLTSESPSWAIVSSLGISVRIDVEVADFPEILNQR